MGYLHHKKDCVGYLHHKKDCVGYLHHKKDCVGYLHHKKDCVGYLHHKKDCVGYLVKATANETSTGALSGSSWSVFGRHIGPALNVKGVRDTRGQLSGPTDTTLCITHTSVVQDTCS